MSCKQSNFRSVSWWEIFMGQELRFRMDLGGVAVLKKKRLWADYEQLLRVAFSCFQGQKNVTFSKKQCSVSTKKLHNMKLFFFS